MDTTAISANLSFNYKKNNIMESHATSNSDEICIGMRVYYIVGSPINWFWNDCCSLMLWGSE